MHQPGRVRRRDDGLAGKRQGDRTARDPGRTTPESKANDPGRKYREGLEKFNEATGYEWKCRQGAVDLGGYFYLLPDRPSIQGSFWFHDEGPMYDYYLKVTANEESKRKYFLAENLDQFDVEEAEKALDEVGVYEYEQNGQKVINIARSQWVDGLRPATDTEKSEILRALKWCRANFSKRLDAYLKRWGTGKLRFGTYWADRWAERLAPSFRSRPRARRGGAQKTVDLPREIANFGERLDRTARQKPLNISQH